MEEEIKKDIEGENPTIKSFDFKQDFKELFEDEDLDEDSLMSFLENIEKLISLSYLLKHNKNIVAVSKTSSSNEIFRVNIPDIALFDKFSKKHLPERDTAMAYQFCEKLPLTLVGKVDYRSLEKQNL